MGVWLCSDRSICSAYQLQWRANYLRHYTTDSITGLLVSPLHFIIGENRNNLALVSPGWVYAVLFMIKMKALILLLKYHSQVSHLYKSEKNNRYSDNFMCCQLRSVLPRFLSSHTKFCRVNMLMRTISKLPEVLMGLLSSSYPRLDEAPNYIQSNQGMEICKSHLAAASVLCAPSAFWIETVLEWNEPPVFIVIRCNLLFQNFEISWRLKLDLK